MCLSTSALLVWLGGGSQVFSLPLQGWVAPILSNNSGVGHWKPVLKKKIFIAHPTPPPCTLWPVPYVGANLNVANLTSSETSAIQVKPAIKLAFKQILTYRVLNSSKEQTRSPCYVTKHTANSRGGDFQPKVRTSRPDLSRIGHFENEIGYFQQFLMKNDFLQAYSLGFDWSGWIALIKSKILITKGMSWPGSADKWKEPLVLSKNKAFTD